MVSKERAFKAHTSLSDWELIAAFTYCKKTRERKDPAAEKDFHALCFFFFNGDEKETEKSLEDVMVFYREEYSKRKAN
jgi:hypothetical protein